MLSRIINKFYSFYYKMVMKSGSSFHIFYPITIINPKLIKIENGVIFKEHIWLNVTSDSESIKPQLFIGEKTYIGRFCQINAISHVEIGKKVLIADRVFISDSSHSFENLNLPIIDQKDVFKGKVIIGDKTWIGCGAVILPGVTIGKHAVIGANSVINTDIPDYCVAVGIPAKVVRKLL